MNRQLIFAIMTGSHRHIYRDASGNCAICGTPHLTHNYGRNAYGVGYNTPGICVTCGAECRHPKDFTAYRDLVEHCCPDCYEYREHAISLSYNGQQPTKCFHCDVCASDVGHIFNANAADERICPKCGYQCAHPADRLVPYNPTQHHCQNCGKNLAHTWGAEVHQSLICRTCFGCGHEGRHTFPSPTPSGCGVCSVCGMGSTTVHDWVTGYVTCSYCKWNRFDPDLPSLCKGYHAGYYYGGNPHSFSTDWRKYCRRCGLTYPADSYGVTGVTTYSGQYRHAGTVNGQNYYRQHVLQNGVWVEGTYYMVKIDITTPTRFGGNYAYTGSGYVFVTSIDSFPINDELFTGTGKYEVELSQYELNGTFKASGSYTSSDCHGLYVG